ncbi:hypothetical protein ACQ4PT_045851 [Festuca glaucescens]
MQPSSFPVGLDTEPQFPHSVSQVEPSIIDCPVGIVPVLRNNTSGTTEAHNIYGVGSMGIERAAAGIVYRDDVYGATVTINVWEPKVNKDSKDFSATWVQINNGAGEHTDRIGAGLIVNPSLSGDTFVRFHIAWTDGLEKKVCIDQSCLGFVLVNRKWSPGARLPHVSVYDGPQWETKVNIFKDPKTKNWWVTYGKNMPVGYWPSGLFTFLYDKGNFAFWGGIVQGPTATSNALQMGSRHFASEGFRRAAAIRNIQILNENNTYVTPEDDSRLVHGTSKLHVVHRRQVSRRYTRYAYLLRWTRFSRLKIYVLKKEK